MLSTLRIAWRNLGRNPRRTALALLAIAIAQIAMLFMDGFVHGYTDSMIDAVTGPMLGHVQVHAPDWRDERAMDLTLTDVSARVAAIRRTRGVARASARIYAPVLAAKTEDGQMGVVVGLDVRAEAGAGGLLEGVPRRALPRGRQVLVGEVLASTLGLHAGDSIAVVGQAVDGSIANDLYTVSGTFSSAVDLVQRLGIVMPLDAAQELLAMPDQAHEIVVRGQDPEGARALSSRLGRLGRLRGTEVLPWEQLVPELVTLVELSRSSSLIVLVLVFVAAAAGIANTMLMATFERLRELGMLLALGTRPLRIVAMILTEATLLGVVGVTIGSLLGWLAVVLLGHSGLDLTTLGNDAARGLSFQGLNYQFSIVPRVELVDVAQGVVAVVLTALLTALWPAVHAARLSPVEAMRS